MKKELRSLWAKTARDGNGGWHPLILHLLDVAACVETILDREPQSTRNALAASFGMDWEKGRPWLLLIVSGHDLGKACPGFQSKWPHLLAGTGLPMPRVPDPNINHAYVSQIALTSFLQEKGWTWELADLVSDAVGCHHGNRASPIVLNDLETNRNALGNEDWKTARGTLLNYLFDIFAPEEVPGKKTLSGAEFMLISGLTSFADWIGSNEEWFPYGTKEDCDNLNRWYEQRKTNASHALDCIGWESRTPLCAKPKSFFELFNFAPRPLQEAVAIAVSEIEEPSVLLIEAPMGEGKTEAAFYAHVDLQRRFQHRGMYVALPTKATGNAMFARTLLFLQNQGGDRKLDLQLVHGAALLNDSFQNMKLSGIFDQSAGGEIRAGEWFTNKKRALLSEYGVGTIDQALVPILPVRHNFVRLWGLANRVVIFDEIHAYDAYTGTLLIYLVQWLLALGSSIILLSATVPPNIRRKLAELINSRLPERESEYPRLTLFGARGVRQFHFDADPLRRQSVAVVGIAADLPVLYQALAEHLSEGGMGLAIVNTVQRAQDLYQLFPEGNPLMRSGQRVGKVLSDGTEILLFHARYPADQRQIREEQVIESFGEKSNRSGRRILIATQVVEQSLDLDFDFITTDLAPIDLILQRVGRLWRHSRTMRPVVRPIVAIAGLDGAEPPSFGKPLWWGSVYREDILLRSWVLLKDKTILTLPDEIDVMVQSVYEESEKVPEYLLDRLEKAMGEEDGIAVAQRGRANYAVIGFPDDASWNQPERFVLFDEDQPGVHRTLLAQTRDGEESVAAIPLFPRDNFRSDESPGTQLEKQWYLRSISLARKGIVKQLQQVGIPEGWKKSPLLRNCFPLTLNSLGHWTENEILRLDDDLGVVYETKEKA